jgi:hypothetical protein
MILIGSFLVGVVLSIFLTLVYMFVTKTKKPNNLIKPFIIILGATSILTVSIYALVTGFVNGATILGLSEGPFLELDTVDKIAFIIITGFILLLFSLDLLIETFKKSN